MNTKGLLVSYLLGPGFLPPSLLPSSPPGSPSPPPSHPTTLPAVFGFRFSVAAVALHDLPGVFDQSVNAILTTAALRTDMGIISGGR